VIGRHDYYLMLAQAVAARANCQGLDVGAVIVKGDRILATGYNGTAAGMPNCLEGGCLRCARRRPGEKKQFKSGTNYDLCSCVHAEANAMATAARFGIPLDGSTLYTTDQPCFSCAKELIQAGVTKVYFIHFWPPNRLVKDDYLRLQGRLSSEQRTPHVPDRTPRERPHCTCPPCVAGRETAVIPATELTSAKQTETNGGRARSG
jgi:dCMP deaminase